MPETLLDTVTFRAVAERSNDVIALVTVAGEVVYLNATGRRLLRWDAASGPLADLLIAAADAKRLVCAVD